ncbi:hypothetical protein Nmel_015649 [Mimus melanotis]
MGAESIKVKVPNFSKEFKLLAVTLSPMSTLCCISNGKSQEGSKDFSQQTYLGLSSTSATSKQ